MAGRAWVVPVALFTLLTGVKAVAQERLWSVAVKGNFTTGSQLFPKSNSSSSVERASYFPIQGIPGFGVEIQYRIPESSLALGFSADYIRGTVTQQIRGAVAVPVEDGYRVIPVEFTGYFLIPLSGPTFGVYMGGGGGVYFGRRVYRIAGVEALPIDQGHGFGIHVLGGVSYRLNEWFSLNGEMKFRDVQFESVNAFNVSQVVYEGRVVSLNRELQHSRIHTDGMVFQLGAAFSF